MNDTLQRFARQALKDGLDKLPVEWHQKFKLMYSGKKNSADALAMPIHDVVDGMPAEKLDWAMQQVENSLRKIEQQLTGTAQ